MLTPNAVSGKITAQLQPKSTMNLSQALKTKNRLAGELVRQQQILQRENARRSDSVSGVDCKAVWDRILKLSDELGVIKGKISTANIGIYPALERMAELKSRISFVQGLQKREGPEMVFVGRDQEQVSYTWTSFINQEGSDKLVLELQAEIDSLQDKVDAYNATTEVV